METWIQTELDSGERVISERLPHVRSATSATGSAPAPATRPTPKAGVSHFIEHLLFKGSSRYSALEIAEIFDGMGGELNAATSREHTRRLRARPEHHVETALDVMGDMVFSPLFDDLDAEREVVLEEIAMYEDTPQELVHDLIGEAVFGSHALGRPVIGTADVISTRHAQDALRSHHAAFYAPPNIVVAAAGTIDHDRLVALVAALDRASRGHHAPGKPRIRPPLVKAPKPGLRFQRKDTEQYHVCLGAPGVSRSDRRRFAASILDAILGGSASSRLFQEIREKRGMAYAVYSFLSQYADTGQIGIYVGTREDNLVEALEITVEQIADIAAGNLRHGELARAQENLKGRLLLSMESTSARMTRLGKSLVTDSEILSLDRLVAEIDASTREAVCGLAAELLAPERLSAAGIGPSEERFLAALEHATPDAGARGVRILLNGHAPPSPEMGKVGGVLGPALVEAGHELVATEAEADVMVDFTTPSAVVGQHPAGVAAGLPCRRRHERVGSGGGRRRRPGGRGAGLLRPELRARRGADDAVRARGIAALRARRRSSSSTTRRSSTRRPAPRSRPRRRWRARCRSTPSGSRGSSHTRRSSSAAAARRSRSATTRSRARRSSRAWSSRFRRSGRSRPGVTVGLDALL